MGRVPDITPEGWKSLLDVAGQQADVIEKTENYGLHAVFSVDVVEEDDTVPDGEYNHMSISRPYQTPGWKECGRYVWESGLFDGERPIIMILRPLEEAGLGFANVFHFWQRREE